MVSVGYSLSCEGCRHGAPAVARCRISEYRPHHSCALTAVCELVTAEMVARNPTCGPDPHRHLDMVRKYID